MKRKLLEIENLSVNFHTPEGIVRAVGGVSFDVAPGETLGLVGESGCGKSVTSLSILGLIASPPGEIKTGRIVFENRDLLALDPENMRRIRGRDISMIFQEPMTSLNPVLTIGRQVAEPLITHKGLSRSQAYEEAATWLEHVKIPAARTRLDNYPHQLSGGMRQRVMIAMAMVCRPKLLIADEPTTALDVTIQAQILALMLGLKEELEMAMVLITHDLGVIAQTASRVSFHPYTRGLLKSVPRLDAHQHDQTQRLNEIPGIVPSLIEDIAGCKFADRCPHVFHQCRQQRPGLFPIRDGQQARCWLKEFPEQRKIDV
jgi:oligopeptide/dipeptide ABC transporter ATP-binding protein